MRKLQQKGKMALFGSAFLWGFGFVAIESALRHGWHPMALLAFRGLIGGLFLLGFSYKRQWWKNKAMVKDGFVAGVYMSLGFLAQTYGQAMSGPANAAFITALYVLFTPMIVSVVSKTRLKNMVFVSAIIAFIGVSLISVNESLRFALGDIILVVGAFMFAVHIVKLGEIGHYDDALSITTIQLFTMSFLSFLTFPMINVEVRAVGLVSIFYVGIISSGVAFFLQTFGQKLVPSSNASVIMTFEAIFGVIGAILFFNELISMQVIFGGFLLLSAVYLLEVHPQPNLYKRRL